MVSEARTTNGYGPPRVVILGSGYGGVYTALKLQKAAKRGQIELSLISRHNFFLCQPMLSEVVSGSIEPTHILSSTRRMLPYANLHQAEISSIELDSRSVVINHLGSQPRFDRVHFDHLVIAVGSSIDLSRLPGMAEHTFPFKTMGDAFSLRNHLISVLEEAEVETDPLEKEELLTFVIAGGGYTGVEVAAEINSFIRGAAASYRHIEPNEVRVILIHSGTRILPVLNDTLAAFSHRVMEKRGVEIRLNTRMAGATAQSAILSDGEVIPTRTLVAAVGTAPNRLLDDMPGERDRSGRLVVDVTLAVPGLPGIWSVCDCAAIPDVRTGGTCPPTAQYAVREAEHVARNILASIKGTRLRPFSHRNLGAFVPLGRWSGAADLMGLRVSGVFGMVAISQLLPLEASQVGTEAAGGDGLDHGVALSSRHRPDGHRQERRDFQGPLRTRRDNLPRGRVGAQLLHDPQRRGTGGPPARR